MSETGGKLAPLTDLPPNVAEAVRYYTDPLMPTFGNKTKSIERAGFNPGSPVLDSERAKKAIRAIQEERQASSEKIQQYMRRHAPDALRELLKQLSAGRDMGDEINTAALLEREDDEARFLTKEEADYLKQANNHNKNLLVAARVRKEALELVLAYAMGTPEQVIRNVEEKRLPDPYDLDKLSDDDLRAVAGLVQEALEKKKAPDHPEVIEGQVEVIE